MGETRRSNRETTPAYLQKQVAALHNHYKPITIRNALNLRSAALNRWCKTYKSHQKALLSQSFITVSPEELS
jgi:hypothetical protein